ncbi:MAG: sporulation protein YqfD, partial [Acutalibacteraceae bacterium]|nr:sporulation protein YqfD [Acutalibacteraceae bacterium]
AEAYTLIRADMSFETVTNRTKPVLTLTDEKVKTTLHFMGINIPLYYKDSGAAPASTRHKHILIGKTVIPLGITRKIYRTYSENTTEADDSKLMLDAVENYMTEKLRRLDRVYICSQTVNIQKDSDTIRISTEILGEISAGIAKKMELE